MSQFSTRAASSHRLFTMLKPMLLAGAACLLLVGTLQPLGAAEEVDSERALKSLARAPWYDGEQQGYTPPKISPMRDNPLRQDGWKAAVKPPKQNTRWNWGGWNFFFAEIFSWALLGLLAAVLITAIVLLGVSVFRNYMPARLNLVGSKGSVKIDPTRVVDLPFDATPTMSDPLAEAERLWRAGRYDEAIVFLYGYILLALDQARKIHLQKGKTNRMYLRELKHTGLKQIAESTMLSFELVFFGKHSLSRESFELAWNQLEEFHRLLAPEQATSKASTVEVATA